MQAETSFVEDYNDDSDAEQEAWNFLDDERSHHHELIGHLPTLGLHFLQNLLEADNSQRTTLVAANYVRSLCVMSDALEHRSLPKQQIYQDEFEDSLSSRKLDFDGDEFQKRNLAWLWSNQYRAQHSYYQGCNIDLRSWGYVFWGKARLDRLGILKEERPDYLFCRHPPHFEERVLQPSAQKRLREMGLA